MNLKRLFNADIYKSLRLIYITLFIGAVLTRVLVPIALCETQFINSLVFSIVAIFGAGVIVLDFFTKRIFLKQKNIIWLIFFLVACAVSNIINFKYGVFGNIRSFVWLSISFFLLYPIDYQRDTDNVKKEIRYIGHILIFVWFVACLISILMFLFQVGFYVDIYPDSFVRLGFLEGRLFGIFEDPNFAAVVAIIVIIFSAFNVKLTQNTYFKIFYFFNILINFCYIVLSGSRTAEVSVLCVSFLLVYFILLKNLRLKYLSVILRQFIIIIVSFLVGIVLLLSINLSRKIFSYLPEFISYSFETASTNESRLRKHIDTTRDDVNNSSDISNCRFKIWLSALELFKSKPIFGTSPRNMRTYAKRVFPEGFIAKRSYAVHNAYLDILTSTGIIGTIFLIIFFVKYLVYVFGYLFFKLKNKNYYMVLVSFSLVTTVAISAFFLSEIFFVNTIGVLIFWLSLGYSYYFIEKG